MISMPPLRLRRPSGVLIGALRREIQAQYEKIAAVNQAKDLDVLLALRSPDFSAQFPDGRIANAEEMACYSRTLFAQMQQPIVVRNTRHLAVLGDKALRRVETM